MSAPGINLPRVPGGRSEPCGLMSEGASCEFHLFISFDLLAACHTRTAGTQLSGPKPGAGMGGEQPRMGNSDSSNGMNIHQAIPSTVGPFQN